VGWQDEQAIIEILNKVLVQQQATLEIVQELQASHKACCSQLNGKLNKILANLVAPAVAFTANITT
jgi:hypothetical protein